MEEGSCILKKKLLILGLVVSLTFAVTACGQEESIVNRPESIYDIIPELENSESFELGVGSGIIKNHMCFLKVQDGAEQDALSALEQFDFTGFEKTEDDKWLNETMSFSNADNLYFKLPDGGWRVSIGSHVTSEPLSQTLWVENDQGEKTIYHRDIEEPPFKSFSDLLTDIDVEAKNTTAALAYHPVDAQKSREITCVDLLRILDSLNGAVSAGEYSGDLIPEYDIRLEIDNTDFILGFFDDVPEGFVQGKSQYLIDSASGLIQLTTDEGTNIYSLGEELSTGLYIILTGER